MDFMTDDEVKQKFEQSAAAYLETFPLLQEHLQRKLKASVFMLDEKSFMENKVKHKYLDEIHQLIKNSITRGTE